MKEKEIVGFEFGEIPLDEAINAVVAGSGNYSDIKSKLLETLPKLPKDKAFGFGIPNGKELPEEQRRGLCMSVNAALKKANVAWRATYSSAKKLFICVPKGTPRGYDNRATRAEQKPAPKPQPAPSKKSFALISPDIKEKAFRLRRDARLSAAKIAAKLGIKNTTAEYLIYTEFPKWNGGKH